MKHLVFKFPPTARRSISNLKKRMINPIKEIRRALCMLLVDNKPVIHQKRLDSRPLVLQSKALIRQTKPLTGESEPLIGESKALIAKHTGIFKQKIHNVCMLSSSFIRFLNRLSLNLQLIKTMQTYELFS